MIEFAGDFFVEEAFIRFYGVELQTRMAILRLSGGRLLLYSPVPLDDALARRLDRLGRVSDIVSPNKIHNQTLAAYRAAFPDATLCVPPGLSERCPGLAVDVVLGEGSQPDWQAELDWVLTAGNVFFSEVLLLHRASETLCAGDFIENFRPQTSPGAGRWLARAFGVADRPMASPEFRYYTHNADDLEHSLAPVDGWPIERIFLCHGALIEAEAGRVFAAVRDEFAATARRRSRAGRAALRVLARLQ